jgi:hypothetical protein
MGALLTLPAYDTGGLLVSWKKKNFPALEGPVAWSGLPKLEGSFAGSSATAMARPLRDSSEWSIEEKADRDHLTQRDNLTIRKEN